MKRTQAAPAAAARSASAGREPRLRSPLAPWVSSTPRRGWLVAGRFMATGTSTGPLPRSSLRQEGSGGAMACRACDK